MKRFTEVYSFGDFIPINHVHSKRNIDDEGSDGLDFPREVTHVQNLGIDPTTGKLSSLVSYGKRRQDKINDTSRIFE